MSCLKERYQPRNNAHDLFYATTWEINSIDVVAALFVRQATQLTVRMNFRFAIKTQLQEMAQDAKQKR